MGEENETTLNFLEAENSVFEPNDENVYPVDLRLVGGSRFTRGVMHLDRHTLLSSIDPKEYGRKLGAALFDFKGNGYACWWWDLPRLTRRIGVILRFR